MTDTLSGLALNVYSGMRLALMLPVRAGDFRVDLAQCFVLFAISLGLNLAYDWYLVWPDAAFNLSGLYYQSLLYLLYFGSAILITACVRAQSLALALAVLVLAIAPTTFLIYTGIVYAAGQSPVVIPPWFYDWLTPVYLAWYLLVVLRAIRLLLAPPAPVAAALLAMFGACNVVPWYYLPPEPLWVTTSAADYRQETPPDVEQLFFQQDELLTQSLHGLMDQRPGVVDLYFVGVAGDAGEDVFMNEAQQAARIFSRDFDAAGRTLLLINNRATYDRVPMASRDNLGMALQGAASRMDASEDLLVLFLTSHGEEDKGLVLDAGGFRLADVTPRGLRAALDGAGISYRVIIVSACFSGAFVEELRDPRSLVITSARRDRSSFGCGHDGLFTYFGSAFLGTELPKDMSLVAAFERARDSLGSRERDEGLPASEPQLWIGSEMEVMLERLRERLRGAASPPAPPMVSREAVSRR